MKTKFDYSVSEIGGLNKYDVFEIGGEVIAFSVDVRFAKIIVNYLNSLADF